MITTNLRDRAYNALNLRQYSELNVVDELGPLNLVVPSERQYVLRILIKRTFGEFQIPTELEWVRPFINTTKAHQDRIGVKQPFVYLTVRNGLVESVTDDEWHVDGFSQTITHLPEQNYLWTDVLPTEYIEKTFNFPDNFDSAKHNVHDFFQRRITTDEVLTMKAKNVYGFDPYVIHRRPKISAGTQRCFLRVSYTPIEIEDINNTFNDLLPTAYVRDGVKAFRDKLVSYD